MNEPLDSAERVHYAMLRGELPRITMEQCAHTWGAEAVRELHYAKELRADLQNISDTLADFEGDTPLKQAVCAVAHIEWLKNELAIHKHYEQTALNVLAQTQRALAQTHEEEGHEQTARQTTGSAGKV